MHVVRVPVVRRVDRADRAERGRTLDGELDRVEAGVRGAVHPDATVAPVLVGEPGDHLDQVGLLLRRVLVLREAPGGAGTAKIDPGDGEPSLRAEALVLPGVRRREIVHPVRERLEDRRGRPLVRKPEARREPHAVGERDPGAAVLHRAHARNSTASAF